MRVVKWVLPAIFCLACGTLLGASGYPNAGLLVETADLANLLSQPGVRLLDARPPEEYRQELLFFADLFADLSGPAPDHAALRHKYWQRVYAIYDHLPQHVDPRPKLATDRLIEFFASFH